MRKVIYFCLLSIMILYFGSCNSSKADKQLDTWIERSCCVSDKNEAIGVRGFSFKPYEGLYLMFCRKLKTELRITLLLKDGEGGYKELLDIKSQSLYEGDEILLGEKVGGKFIGDYSSLLNLKDGSYRFYIGAGSSCGEITFSIENGLMVSSKLLCMSHC